MDTVVSISLSISFILVGCGVFVWGVGQFMDVYWSWHDVKKSNDSDKNN